MISCMYVHEECTHVTWYACSLAASTSLSTRRADHVLDAHLRCFGEQDSPRFSSCGVGHQPRVASLPGSCRHAAPSKSRTATHSPRGAREHRSIADAPRRRTCQQTTQVRNLTKSRDCVCGNMQGGGQHRCCEQMLGCVFDQEKRRFRIA